MIEITHFKMKQRTMVPLQLHLWNGSSRWDPQWAVQWKPWRVSPRAGQA